MPAPEFIRLPCDRGHTDGTREPDRAQAHGGHGYSPIPLCGASLTHYEERKMTLEERIRKYEDRIARVSAILARAREEGKYKPVGRSRPE